MRTAASWSLDTREPPQENDKCEEISVYAYVMHHASAVDGIRLMRFHYQERSNEI